MQALLGCPPSPLEPRPSVPSEFDLPFEQLETDHGLLWRASRRHGEESHVGAIPLLSAADADMRLLGLLGLDPSLGAVDPKRLLYLDTETTGLGGAGTVAFLVGLAFYDPEGHFVLEQLFLKSPTDERALLEHLRQRIENAEALVTFNGKSFDLPLLAGRTIQQRTVGLPPRPHLDLLHVARRLHKKRLTKTRLVHLEAEVLGWARGEDDVSGADIAPRYAHFLRTQDPTGLLPVFEHNAWDVLTMVALVGLYGDPSGLLHPEDLVEAATVLLRTKSTDTALAWAELARDRGARFPAESALAQIHKARGERDQALAKLESLVAELDDPKLRFELVKLYEHFAKDYEKALTTLALGVAEPADKAEHRRVRLENKRHKRLGA